MMECERCGEAVERVLRHRAYGVAVTHRVTRWLCPGCHPTGPTADSSATDAKRPHTDASVVTDGGTVTTCPHCSSQTVNVHGIHNCVDCRWASH